MRQTTFEQEIARLIVESLQLEVEPSAIEPEEPLFHDGLGLDSIDALELALAISRSYRVELRSEDEQNRRVFASLRSLSDYVATNRK